MVTLRMKRCPMREEMDPTLRAIGQLLDRQAAGEHLSVADLERMLRLFRTLLVIANRHDAPEPIVETVEERLLQYGQMLIETRRRLAGSGSGCRSGEFDADTARDGAHEMVR
jgi:hypothetical protein